MLERAANLAKFLLEINAVKLNPENPFTWTSGIKAPIYCDNRLILSYPDVRSFVIKSLADLINENFHDYDTLAGVATAGIPHAALVAAELNKPMCYVRPEPKKHGMKNQIEGRLEPGTKVILVEDLISTGKSSLQAAAAVKEAGGVLLGLVGLFTYGFPEATANFAKFEIPFYTLSNLEVLTDTAAEFGYISRKHLQSVKDFAKDPQGWGNAL